MTKFLVCCDVQKACPIPALPVVAPSELRLRYGWKAKDVLESYLSEIDARVVEWLEITESRVKAKIKDKTGNASTAVAVESPY